MQQAAEVRPLPRAGRVRTGGDWVGSPVGQVSLDFDQRHRRRISMRTDTGVDFLLDLPQAARLCHGDGLEFDDGRIVVVRAAPECLLEVRGRDTAHLARLAWHVGNRHLAAEIGANALFIRADHVIEHMLDGLGASVRSVSRPFNPEAGAYSQHRHDTHGAA